MPCSDYSTCHVVTKWHSISGLNGLQTVRQCHATAATRVVPQELIADACASAL
jgi:hypothetical protein